MSPKNRNQKSTKHKRLAEILELLNTPINDNMFSKGSTITLDGLEAIFDTLTKYHVKTKPIPPKFRVLLLRYLRGFEAFYRTKTDNDLIIDARILPSGEISMQFISPEQELYGEDVVDDFVEWLKYVTTVPTFKTKSAVSVLNA
ncbi:hypothetical protein K8I31_09060 [bacterium]|nr:hypothetical protein [bacterium]